MMRKTFFLMMSFWLTTGLLNLKAQDWDYGDFATEGPMKKAVLQDNYESAPEAALPALQWLLENTPDAHKNLYIYAGYVYNGMVDVKMDSEEYDDAMAYADTALMIYDKRIEKYGEREKVIPYKGYYAYYYWSEIPEKSAELYTLYEEVIKIQENSTPAVIIEDYMRLVSARKHSFDNEFRTEIADDEVAIAILDNLQPLGEISEDEIIGIYDNLMSIAEANTGDPEQDWAAVKTYLDETFQSTVTIDCDYVKKTFGGKYQEEPNIDNAEQLVAQMLNAGCEISSEPMFEEALAMLYANEPTYSRCMALAVLSKSKGDNAAYLKYVEEGISLASSNEDKAKAYMILAQNSSYAQGRSYAMQAANYGATYDAYTYVGNLYMQSGSMCTNENPVLARACYLAAYDMYAKAGNSAKMSQAQQYFPSIDDIFTYGMEVGQSISVGCWIGGSTTLRKR